MHEIASFGRWLKLRRIVLELTQAELARLVGCAEITIRKIEADERRPSPLIAERLAQHLELAPEECGTFVKTARAELGAIRLPAPTQVTSARQNHNLPTSLTPLIGRDHEVAAVCAYLCRDDVRLLTLTGPGGVGKTRMALQVAAALAGGASPAFRSQSEQAPKGAGQFPDGVWLIALAPIRAPDLVIPAIAQALGLREHAAQSPLEQLQARLDAKRVLLLLDNFEHVAEAAPQVAELLSAAPGVKVLVTSRVALRLSGEYEIAVPPLALPPDVVRTFERSNVQRSHTEIMQYAAVRLFIARGRSTPISPSRKRISRQSPRSVAGSMGCRWRSSWPLRGLSYCSRRHCWRGSSSRWRC